MQQLTWSKTRSEVDNNCKNDGTGDAGDRIVDVDPHSGKGPKRKRDDADDDCGLCHGLGLGFSRQFSCPK